MIERAAAGLRKFAGPIFISIYFLLLTARAIHTFFSRDDLLNLYLAWVPRPGQILTWNLLFFLPSDLPRPLGSGLLRVLYSVAGFHPAPFKIVNLTILIANIFLTYALARRLANTKTAAALAALLGCYQGKAVRLYIDTGYVFDVLCYFFYFAAAIIYVRAREGNRDPGWPSLTTCCALYICALNSKELAVTFPVFLLLYELIYHGWRPRPIRRWTGIVATGLITVAVIAGRMVAAGNSLIHAEGYRPSVSWPQFILTSASFGGDLFLRAGPITPVAVLAIWTAMLTVACFSRSRALRFAWCFLMLSPLPVAFIPPRGLAQYYIPLFGWALYAGVLMEIGFTGVLARIRFAHPDRARVLASACLLLLSIGVLTLFWRNYEPTEPYTVLIEGEENRSFAQQLRHLEPSIPPHARLMFIDDPFPNDREFLALLIYLMERDSSIEIDRAKLNPNPPEAPQLGAYDAVFDYRAGHLYLLGAPWRLGPSPTVALAAGHAALFHADLKLVNRADPAQRGEYIVLKAADLGITTPPLAPGAAFPQSPLVPVAGKIEVRVNGVPASFAGAVGWPGESNLYRVDLRLPANMTRGMCWMSVTAGGITGPAVEFPVR